MAQFNTPQNFEPWELIERAKAGDQIAFGELYQAYLVPVYRYIYARVWHREVAEDLAQTVFLKVYRALARFEVREQNPLAYFFTVARNTVHDYWRKKKDILLEDKHLLNAHTEAEALPQDYRLLERAIKELSAEQQEVVGLKFFNDLSTRDIAKLLGKTEAAVRQIQSRALKHLRQIINPHDL